MIFGRRREEAAEEEWREPEPVPPEFGPYDIATAPDDGVNRVDLGALRIPSIPGISLQMEAAPDGQIIRVQLEHEGSRLQLAAFAAPRTEGIWDEVRAELRTALLGSGAKVVEVSGTYGPELAARVPQAGGTVEVRHVGIDGPRWFLHAVFIGPAAADPDRAGPLTDVLRALVVDRGSEARPVKEALPLRLPPEYQAQLTEMAAAQKPAAGQTAAAQTAASPAPASPAGAARKPRKATGRPSASAKRQGR